MIVATTFIILRHGSQSSGLYFSQVRCFLCDTLRYLATPLHAAVLYVEYILRIDMLAIMVKAMRIGTLTK
jgi:hypothetical protein